MNKVILYLTIPFILSACGGNQISTISANTIEDYLSLARAENDVAYANGEEFLWSHVLALFDDEGELVLYGNQGAYVENLGDLGKVGETFHENMWFAYFSYKGHSEGLISRFIDGTHIEGDVYFEHADGSRIEIDAIESGMVFLIRRIGEGYKDIWPLDLEVDKIVYLGTIEDPGFADPTYPV